MRVNVLNNIMEWINSRKIQYISMEYNWSFQKDTNLIP